MKLLKPDWTHHDGKPIFSIDVHPDGSKFATGGQGNDSGRVVIWNMLPLLSEEAELDKNCPKILCQLDQHVACVNCVRWSANGLMLASCGDDKLVMVWKKGKGPSAVFGNTGITKVAESWRCIVTMREHEGDVLDLAWSPQDRWLATCSVDNTIKVWDMVAGSQGSAVSVAWLRGHTGLVKGVTWDPVGKFMASQSDDRSVKIWKTADWTCQSTITEPFEECGGTTHILRLSWSPDGLYLVSAHAMNGGGPTAQIIEREGFKCDKDFVGHRKAVTCVRFHNSILRRQAPTTSKWQQYCCLAIGSRDRSLSVWMTALQRPLVVVNDLFQDSILDLSWNTDNHILLACSTDGTVACLQFAPEELGTPLSQENKNSLYQRMYGQSSNVDLNVTQDKTIVLEYAELLNANESTNDITNGLPPPLPVVATAAANVVEPNRMTAIECADDYEPMTPVKAAIMKQFETRAKDGRRRITPMFIPLEGENGLDSVKPELNSVSRTNIETKATADADSAQPPASKVLKLDPKSIKSEETDVRLDNRLAKTGTPSSAGIPALPQNGIQPTADTTNKTQSHTNPYLVEIVGKSIPTNGKQFQTTNALKIEVTNGSTSTSFGALSKLKAVNAARTTVWEIFIGSAINRFCVSTKYVLTCSVDGTARFLDILSGALLMPVVKLPCLSVQCCFSPNSEYVGVVCENGLVRVWKLREPSVFINTNCSDVLTTGQLSNFHITDSGVVFIMLGNGCSYSYSKQLESWLVVNSRDPIVRIGVASFVQSQSKNIRQYPLNTVQSMHNNQFGVGRGFKDRTNTDWEKAAKLSFIENQINIAKSINSAVEFEHWYGILGLHLAEHGTEAKVRMLLDQLVGVPSGLNNSHASNQANDKYLGIPKQRLLRKLLSSIQTTPRWQRIYIEYSEQLND